MDVLSQRVNVEELVATAINSLGPRSDGITVDVPRSLPVVLTDPVLVERAIANLVDNSLIHAAGDGLRVEAGAVAGYVDIRVVDRGPGIRREDREVVFQPFQRLGDSENGIGVGLGLAVTRGFVEAAGGDLEIEDTPGGGCTMVIRIPVADPEADSSSAPVLGSDAMPPLEAGWEPGFTR